MSRRQSKSKYYHNKRKPKQIPKQQQNSKLQHVVTLSQDLMSSLIELIEESDRDSAVVAIKEERDMFAKYIVTNWEDDYAPGEAMSEVYLKAKALIGGNTQEIEIGETAPAPQGD